MTLLGMCERYCNEYMLVAVHDGGRIVAAYDGRDSIPVEYNDREIEKVKFVAYPIAYPNDDECVIVSVHAYLKEV